MSLPDIPSIRKTLNFEKCGTGIILLTRDCKAIPEASGIIFCGIRINLQGDGGPTDLK